jgi:hypothetical protein
MRQPPLRDLMAIFVGFALTIGIGVRARSHQHEGGNGDSAAMKRLFHEDQADRDIDEAMTDQQRAEWRSRVLPRDAQRRTQVMALISRGELHTGADFEEAAVIFQHGDKTDDFLFAHTLAIAAVAKGRTQSRWLAAATLDRYLHRMNQPQIYGTESLGSKIGNEWSWTQDPYNRGLIPDSLRGEMCVLSLAEQQHSLELLRAGKESPERKQAPGCE